MCSFLCLVLNIRATVMELMVTVTGKWEWTREMSEWFDWITDDVYLLRMWSYFFLFFRSLAKSLTNFIRSHFFSFIYLDVLFNLGFGMHYFMIRLSVSRSLWPIKDDVRCLVAVQFCTTYIRPRLCICIMILSTNNIFS